MVPPGLFQRDGRERQCLLLSAAALRQHRDDREGDDARRRGLRAVAADDGQPALVLAKRRVDDDRKPQIEAAIVRVMKARRRLDHNGVVQEVTKQLSARFIPNPTDIKKHLENLIEREFIERDRNDRKTYVYLA